MKKESTRYVTSVTVNTSHFLANMLAFKKILGMPIKIAKPLAKASPGTRVELVPYYELQSEYSTDEVKEQLEEYEIEITVTNQL